MRFLLFFTLFFVATALFASSDSLSLAADYYYLRHDYRQAFQLWKEVFKRQPTSVHAMTRVTELKLLFETRQGARDVVLKFLEENGDRLDPKVRKGVKEHLGVLQKTFVSDDVQSMYLQAKPKLRYKDWGGALSLLNQALSQDPGNFSILKDKATCEFELGQWENFIETTRLAYEAFPFDEDVLENFLEGLVYRGEFAGVVSAVKRDPESVLSERQRLSFGYALLETGALTDGIFILQSLLAEKKTVNFPAIYFALGKAYLKKSGMRVEGIHMYEKFLALLGQPQPPSSTVWDPYRLAEKVEETKKTLSEMKAPPVG